MNSGGSDIGEGLSFAIGKRRGLMQSGAMAAEGEQHEGGEFTFPHLVKWVEMAVRARIEREMRDFPISSSQLFAIVLLEARSQATSAELARMMRLTPQAMTTLLGPLRRDGYIAATPDKAHRRRLLLGLTAKGRATLERARELTPTVEEEFLADFSASERALLKRMLARIAERFD
jgi:DNA-binding MarR family transcriptional regulator